MGSLITAAARALAGGDASPCATTRPLSHFWASRWRSSAILFERRICCEERHAPLAPKRSWHGHGAGDSRSA
jgi:hypothetical protein